MSMAGVTDLLRIFGDERYMLAYTEKKKKRKTDKGGCGGGGGGSEVKADGGDGVADRGIVSVILHRDATGADTVKSLLALEYFLEELKGAGFKVVGAPPPAVTSSSRNAGGAKAVNGDSAVAAAPAPAAAVSPAATAPPGVTPQTVVAAEGVGMQQASGVTQGVVAATPPNSNEAASVPLRTGGREEERRHPSAAELRRCLEAARRRANEGAPGFFAALEVLGWSTEKFMFGNIKSRVEWRL